MSDSGARFSYGLMASVLVNLLLVGLIAGYLIGRPDRGGGPAGPPPGPMHSEYELARGIVEAIPESGRRETIGAFRDVILDHGPSIRERMAAREALRAAIASEPFDEARVREAFDNMREVDQALQAAFQGEIVERLSALTPQELQEISDAMARPARWRERRFQRRHEDEPGQD